MGTTNTGIWTLVFYVLLGALVAVLVLKKRKQVKDSIDIDHKNESKNENDEN